MKQEIRLNYDNQTANVQTGFTTNQIIVMNNTSGILYIRRGNSDIPDAQNYDYFIKAGSSVTLPSVYNLFGLRLIYPVEPSNDTTCLVIFLYEEKRFSKSNQNHYEIRLNCSNSNNAVSLPFETEQVLVMNNSRGSIYINRGSLSAPTSSNYDYYVPPFTYVIIPVKAREFYFLMDDCSNDLCVVIFNQDYCSSIVNTNEVDLDEDVFSDLDYEELIVYAGGSIAGDGNRTYTSFAPRSGVKYGITAFGTYDSSLGIGERGDAGGNYSYNNWVSSFCLAGCTESFLRLNGNNLGGNLYTGDGNHSYTWFVVGDDNFWYFQLLNVIPGNNAGNIYVVIYEIPDEF